jgi:hypothetical protein
MKLSEGSYEIRVEGHLDSRWVEWFNDMNLEHSKNGETILTGVLADQAALHGVLLKICDLGLKLISVRRVDEND